VHVLWQNLWMVSVPHGLRKGYGSMTHGAYATYRTDGAHGTPETN
jgi:hypothetical protein